MASISCEYLVAAVKVCRLGVADVCGRIMKKKWKMLFHHLESFSRVVYKVVNLLDAFLAALFVIFVPSHGYAVRNVFLLFELLQSPIEL